MLVTSRLVIDDLPTNASFQWQMNKQRIAALLIY